MYTLISNFFHHCILCLTPIWRELTFTLSPCILYFHTHHFSKLCKTAKVHLYSLMLLLPYIPTMKNLSLPLKFIFFVSIYFFMISSLCIFFSPLQIMFFFFLILNTYSHFLRSLSDNLHYFCLFFILHSLPTHYFFSLFTHFYPLFIFFNFPQIASHPHFNAYSNWKTIGCNTISWNSHSSFLFVTIF